MCPASSDIWVEPGHMLLQAQDSFVEAHPDRGLVKKWVRGKIKEVGEYCRGCWEIKAEALQAAGGHSSCFCLKAVQAACLCLEGTKASGLSVQLGQIGNVGVQQSRVRY